MPPCIDVYVWVDSCDPASVIGQFIDRYVDTCAPGDPRYYAFVRQFVWKKSRAGDREELAEIRRDDARNALSLYVHSRSHYQAIITITEEGGVVLGLSIDDADDDPDVLEDRRTAEHSDVGVRRERRVSRGRVTATSITGRMERCVGPAPGGQRLKV